MKDLTKINFIATLLEAGISLKVGEVALTLVGGALEVRLIRDGKATQKLWTMTLTASGADIARHHSDIELLTAHSKTLVKIHYHLRKVERMRASTNLAIGITKAVGMPGILQGPVTGSSMIDLMHYGKHIIFIKGDEEIDIVNSPTLDKGGNDYYRRVVSMIKSNINMRETYWLKYASISA